MLRSSFSGSTGRRWLAVAGLAATAASAACNDAATAPETVAVPQDLDGPSAWVGPLAATVTIRVVDTTGTTLKETSWVRFSTGPDDTLSVYDNTAKDQDPAVGVLKVALKKTNNYTACFGRSQHYFPDYHPNLQKWPKCRTVTSNAMTADLGKVYAQRMPMVTLITRNQFGTLVGGAEFEFSIETPSWKHKFTDGNPSYDESPGANGIITYSLGWPNKYKICEVSPPPKTVLTSIACHTIEAKWGQTFTFTLSHEAQIF